MMLQNWAGLKYFMQNKTLYEVTAMHHECTSTEAPLESLPGTGYTNPTTGRSSSKV